MLVLILHKAPIWVGIIEVGHAGLGLRVVLGRALDARACADARVTRVTHPTWIGAGARVCNVAQWPGLPAPKHTHDLSPSPSGPAR